MTRRVRTTKSLAKRMDLQYFTHLHPLRRWCLYLSVIVPMLVVVWFFSQRATGQKVYSSGPVSASHAFFGKKCELCHVTEGGVFRKQVSDQACLACHDAPAHHPTLVTSNPTCSSCHVEHKSSVRLARTMDAGCVQCHSDLKVKSGDLKYSTDIEDFDHHHPEFAALRPGATDPGTVKLNHYVHLQPKLSGPNGHGDPVQMTCHDCHRPASDHSPWPYAREIQACPADANASTPAPQTTSASVQYNPRRTNPRAYMAPIKFATQCAGCHMRDLQFDNRFSESVPHCRTNVVQASLVKKYTDYIAAHPSAMSEPLTVNRVRLSSLVQLPSPPRTREEWVRWQVANADSLLFGKGCKLCHTMVVGTAPIPIVANAAIPVRWWQHADFDHDAHRMMKCIGCHAQAPNSRKTSDILLPGIKTCQSCHQQAGPLYDAADGRCSECHQYHDWQKEQQLPKDRFTIPQLRSSTAALQ